MLASFGIGEEQETWRLWDASNGKLLRTFATKESPASFLRNAISPDGRLVACAFPFSLFENDHKTDEVYIWDLESGKPVSHRPKQTGVVAIAFSPDGKLVATGSVDKSARLWDVASGNQVGTSLMHGGTVIAVTFSPDGKLVATGSEDKSARLWDVASSNQVGTSLMHGGTVIAVTFSPDGKLVATGSEDKTARLWEVRGGKALGKPFMHRKPVTDIAISPNGKLVASSSGENAFGFAHFGKGFAQEGNELRLWETASGNAVDQGFAHVDNVITHSSRKTTSWFTRRPTTGARPGYGRRQPPKPLALPLVPERRL